MLTLLREISLRHFRNAPFRTALVMFGIALGVAMLCAVLATNRVLSLAFEDMADRVAGKADLTVAGSSAGIPGSLTGEIAEVEGVQHAAAMLEVVTRTTDGKGGSLLVLGVDFLGDTVFLPFAQEGDQQFVEDPLAFVNDPTAILVTKKLAAARGLAVGAPLTLLTSEGPTTFKVRGLLEDSGPAASFGGQVVVMFIDAAQVTFTRGYTVDRIDVVVSEGHDVDAVKARIEKVVAGRARVERPRGRTHRLVGALGSFQNGLNMSGLIALCCGMFLIYNAVSVSVAQRRREVGTLRALGVTKRRMVLLFCLEALVLAVIGSALGLFLAQALAQSAISAVTDSVNRLWLPIQPKPPELTTGIIVRGAIAGLATTVLAAYFPARRTNKVSPAEALRATRSSVFVLSIPEGKLALMGVVVLGITAALGLAGGEDNGYLATCVLNIGAALCVPLVIKVIHGLFVRPVEAAFGISGRIAVDNVERSLGRSATTVIALMMAVAMSTSVGGYAKSFETALMKWAEGAFPADAIITFGSPLVDREHVPFTPKVLEEIRQVDGVAELDGARSITFDYHERRMELQAADTELSFRLSAGGHRPPEIVLDGPKTGLKDVKNDVLVEKPRVILSENAARYNHLSAGDIMEIETPSGVKQFEVFAVVVNYSSDQGAVMMDIRWFREYWKDELLDAVSVFFKPGADPEKVAAGIRARLSNTSGMFVTLQRQLREELQATAKSLFAYARAPELIALMVAIMGVIGTMLAAIIDRIREIGMLRAIGATRRQVIMSLIGEAAFMGLTAAVCGLLAGVPLGLLLVKVVGAASSGWDLQYVFPVEAAIRVAFLVTAAAALAGIFPGRRVARMDVKEALSYE